MPAAYASKHYNNLSLVHLFRQKKKRLSQKTSDSNAKSQQVVLILINESIINVLDLIGLVKF